jgi:hypothetical protein
MAEFKAKQLAEHTKDIADVAMLLIEERISLWTSINKFRAKLYDRK